MADIIAIVNNLEFQITRTCIKEAPPPSCWYVDHDHLSWLEISLVVARQIPTGLRGGDGAWLGLVNEGVAEAHGGCLARSREKRLTISL